MLHQAARLGSIQVQDLLSSIKDQDNEVKRSTLNSKDAARGWTSLHRASVNGQLEVCKLLLENGCDANFQDRYDRTALHLASRHGRTEIVRILLDHNCDINMVNRCRQTALYLAADAGHTEIASLLLKKDCDLNIADNVSRTPLHRAAFQGHVEIAQLLVTKHCQLNLADDKGMTALHLASYKGHTDVVRVLVEAGALLDLEESLSRTALYFGARREGLGEMTEVLRSNGAQFTTKHLNAALNLNDHRVIDTLVNLKHIDASKQSRPNEWAMTVVCGGSNPLLRFSALKRLAKIGLLEYSTTSDNPLAMACKNNLLHIVKFLAKRNPDAVNIGTPTPLWHAANGNHEKVVKFLAKNFKGRIDLDAVAPDGTTSLMIAISKEYFDLLPHFLLLYGKDNFKILEALIKFGKPDMFMKISAINTQSKLRRFLSRIKLAKELVIDRDHLKVLMENAIKSDCAKTYKCVSSLFKEFGMEQGQFSHLVEERQCLEMRVLAGVNSQLQNSLLVCMSRVFPAFNSAVEHKWTRDWLPKDNQININKDISQQILTKFCCLTNSAPTYRISEMKLPSCENRCRQKNHCKVIKHLLTAAQRLEQKLQTSCDILQYMQPQFYLIGSIPEATRMGRANEADISMKFAQTIFRMGRSNTEMLLPEDEEAKTLLKDFIKEGTLDTFDYSKFLVFLMKTLESCFKKVDLSDLILEVVKWNQDFQPCDGCQAISYSDVKFTYQSLMHCVNCLPLVTHTKLGPCLILRKTNKEMNSDCKLSTEEQEKDSFVVTIDLIPLFPFSKEDAARSFFNTIKTLTLERPSGWLDHFNSIMKKDILLPDNFSMNQKSEAHELLHDFGLADKKTVHYVSIKLLHHGPEPNYMIRPGQRVQIEEFGSNEVLKSVYIHMKALRDLLNADLKSFFMKKVVLFPEFISNFDHVNDQLSRIGLQDKYRGKGQKEIDTEEFRIFNSLLFEAMSHVDVKHAFGVKIDYDLWADNIAKKVFVGKIPLRMTA